MTYFIREKDFYRRLFSLSMPIILQNLISVGVGLLDIVMLMFVSETDLAACSLANQPTFLFVVFTFGLASGATVLTAQYWGKGDTKTINKIFSIALQPSIIVGFFVSLLTIFAPRFVMSIYTNNTAIIISGASYLRIVGASFMFMAITSVYLIMLRSVENVKVSMYIYLISFIVNAILNYLLVFGNFGFPKLGIEGSATATLIARFLELVLVLLYSRFKEKLFKLPIKLLFVFHKRLFNEYIKYALPVILNEFLWATGMSAQQMILGRLGADAIAASSIASIITRLSTVACIGVACATAVIVGKTAGSGDLLRAKKEAHTLVAVSVLFGVFAAIVVLVASFFSSSITTLSASATALVGQMFLVCAVYAFFQSFNITNLIGVLRAGGDTKFALFADISSLYVTTVILGTLAAFVFHAPIIVVYIIMMSDELIKVPIGLSRLISGKWLSNITREH